MSLTPVELARTRDELHANLALTGLTTEQIGADLGCAPATVESALDPGTGDPVDVWLLRDYLEQAVRDAGRTPVPFTILTDQAKLRARRWFPLREAPRHDFATA